MVDRHEQYLKPSVKTILTFLAICRVFPMLVFSTVVYKWKLPDMETVNDAEKNVNRQQMFRIGYYWKFPILPTPNGQEWKVLLSDGQKGTVTYPLWHLIGWSILITPVHDERKS